jgi:hypothetical protein
MPAVKRLIAKQTLLANVASFTFSNIPQIYTDLILVTSARSSSGNMPASGADFVSIALNGTLPSTGRSLYGVGTTAGSATVSNLSMPLTDPNTTANTFASSQVYFPNYQSSAAKAAWAVTAAENNGTAQIQNGVALWSSVTSPVTSMTLTTLNSNSYVAGSTFYLYGVTQVPVIVGGTETVVGGYKVHTFTSTSSLRVIEGGSVEYLVVAGGGGGGDFTGGGGGAGGLLTGWAGMPVGTQTITVGGGGAIVLNNQGVNGNNSALGSIVTATGGGGGGSNGQSSSALDDGKNGGSGGGGGSGVTTNSTGGTGTSGQGNNGGGAPGGASAQSYYPGGGGGGANAAGVAPASGNSNGGNGGDGRAWGGVIYAGGGGGGIFATGSAGSGGSGGGGAGTLNGTAFSGASNTGGGGGGSGANQSNKAGAGGSGIVIIRYPHIGN